MPLSFQGPPAPPNRWKSPTTWLTMFGMGALMVGFLQGDSLTKAVTAGGFALLCSVFVGVSRG